jgi:hypothetical protein
VLAPVFDTAVIYEAGDLRGRVPGELMDLQERFLTAAGMDASAIERIGGEEDAIRRAVETAEPGELVCYMTGRVQAGIRLLTALAEAGLAAEREGGA